PDDRTQGHLPVDRGQCQLHGVAASIHVGDGDQVAVGAVEHQRAVLEHGLGGRQVVDRRVVDRGDDQRDVGVDLQGAAAAGVAVVVDRDRHGLYPGGIERAEVGQATVADQGVDVGDGAFQGDGVGAV